MRFTPLVVAKIRSTAQTHHTGRAQLEARRLSKRVNDSVVSTSVHSTVGDGEADGDDEQADGLGPLGEAEVALVARP